MRNLLLILLFLSISAWGYAQKKLLQKPYQAHNTKGSIADFLNDINRQNGIVLEYS